MASEEGCPCIYGEDCPVHPRLSAPAAWEWSTFVSEIMYAMQHGDVSLRIRKSIDDPLWYWSAHRGDEMLEEGSSETEDLAKTECQEVAIVYAKGPPTP